VAVRGSCGQPEIWSAGSKHHVTALKESSQRSGLIAGSSPPKSNDVSGRPRFILQPLSRPGQCPQTSPHRPTTPATARQRTPASTAGQPRKFSRRHRVPQATSGLIREFRRRAPGQHLGPLWDHTQRIRPDNQHVSALSADRHSPADRSKRLDPCPGGQGVAGSNPAVPTDNRAFSKILVPHKSQQESHLIVKWPFQRRAPITCPGLLPGHLSIRQSRRNRQPRNQRSLSHPGSAQQPRQLRTREHHPGAPVHRKPDAHPAAVAVGRGQAGTLTPGLPTPSQTRWLLA